MSHETAQSIALVALAAWAVVHWLRHWFEGRD